jgi:hypothetical protein
VAVAAEVAAAAVVREKGGAKRVEVEKKPERLLVALGNHRDGETYPAQRG